MTRKGKHRLEVDHGLHICDIEYNEARKELLLFNGRCGFYGTMRSIRLLTDIIIEGIPGVSAIRLKEIVSHHDDNVFTLKFETRKSFQRGKKVKPKLNVHDRQSISRRRIK